MNVNKNKCKIMLLVVLITALPTFAQKTQDTISISLAKALEIAMSKSPTIKVADKEIERIDYSKKERLSALFPTISGSGTYSRTISKSKSAISMNGTPMILEFGVDNSFSAGISASLPIIAPTLWATLKMNEYDTKLVLESARSSQISLVNQIKKAYYSVLLSQDSYDVFERSYKNSFENANVIQNKFKQGTVSEYEWIRADVQVKNAESNLTSAESAVNMSKLQLKLLMGLDMEIQIKVLGKLSEFETDKYVEIMKVDTGAINKNSDLIQFDIKSKQLDQSLKVQQAAWLPTLGASINYSLNSIGNDAQKMFSGYTSYPASSLGLSLSVPVFQGGSKYYKYKQIKIQQDELKIQRESLKSSIDLQLLNCIDNIKKSIKKIESNKDGLKQAEKALSISQKMYDVGSSTYLDLTNSQLAYITAGLTYNQSIFDYLSAKADLEKLLGKDTK